MTKSHKPFSSHEGGAISFVDCSDISFEFCTFDTLSAGSGGAISLMHQSMTASGTDHPRFQVKQSTFAGCFARLETKELLMLKIQDMIFDFASFFFFFFFFFFLIPFFFKF